MTNMLLTLLVLGVLIVAFMVNLGTIVIWIARRIRVAAGGDRRLKRGSG
jgi:Na+/H+ antiporter NhaD/arsenite permease-like protein